jgi:hypothetical protein
MAATQNWLKNKDVPPCVGQLIALSIAGNSFGSRRKLRRKLF